jgi:hypothetical protein
MFRSFDHLQVEIHNTEIINLATDPLFSERFVFLIDDLLLYIVKSCHCRYWLNLSMNMYVACRYALLLEYYNLESI